MGKGEQLGCIVRLLLLLLLLLMMMMMTIAPLPLRERRQPLLQDSASLQLALRQA